MKSRQRAALVTAQAARNKANPCYIKIFKDYEEPCLSTLRWAKLILYELRSK